ncbi:twin-arginine translocase subunit TatC [Haloferax prahovense]|uniref:twin-arginine translocase subunit TatC n=1 Tax=Haloferax prahovense TaxID=381852 RepID=UPI003C709A7D
MDPTETVDAFDPRRRGLSPLGAAARRHARRLVAIGLSTAGFVFATARDPGLLSPAAGVSPTAGVSTAVVTVGDPTFLVRLELGVLAGLLAAGASLVFLADRDPAVDIRAAWGWFALAAAGFLVGTAVASQVAPALFDLLVEWGRITADSRQSALELELFFPVAVGGGAAVAPLLLGLRRAGALSRRLTGGTRGLSLLCLVAFAACFSPPDSTTFALYSVPPAVGLGVAVAWVEFG